MPNLSLARRKIEISNGARIGIIGGGPAGSFFAIKALKLAERRNIKIKVTVLDDKKFITPGPRGCNMCAGIISDNLVKLLSREGIVLPAEKVQRKIDGYYFHTRTRSLYLRPTVDEAIYTVFRGNGPIRSTPGGNVSFDSFLLETAKQRGASVLDARIRDILLPDVSEAPVKCVTIEEETLSFDLLVGACGLNMTLLRKFKDLNFGYLPPPVLRTFQTEVHLDEKYIGKHFGNNVHTFVLGLKRIEFVAMVPKRDYVTLSLVGNDHMSREDLVEFLNHKVVKEKFPDTFHKEDIFCACAPRIAISHAQNPATNRLVIIGDASYCRYYKNGIESAFTTATLAAKTALLNGIDVTSFKRHYFSQANQRIVNDNLYGKIFFRINKWMSKSDIFTQTHLDLASSQRIKYPAKVLREILWIMFTGKEPYKRAFLKSLNPLLQLALFLYTIRTIWKQLETIILKAFRDVTKHPDDSSRSISNLKLAKPGIHKQKIGIDGWVEKGLGPLKHGQTVVIIGGGPGGTSCGIALKNLAQERGININVIIYEGKVFEGVPHYNQCVGVLSPPIANILEHDLKIPFPQHLTQRVIDTYVLHSDNKQIKLVDEDKPSQILRRVTFDNYMLQEAIKKGVEVVQSRVTDVEFSSHKVMVYSESDNRPVDVVVGAFGMDLGTARVFERATAYRQPRFLNSIVTKIYPSEEFMNAFGNCIHAFLPSLRKIEFGAVTPKMNHLTINIAGDEISSDWMDEFLSYAPVRNILPPGFKPRDADLKYHKGRFPVRPAQKLFGDRYVMVGDATGLVRPFKGKGVNSACLTGLEAAKTIMGLGISREAFGAYLETFHEVTEDVIYGKLLRWLTISCANFRVMDGVIELATQENKLRQALFNCVSAHKSFKKIAAETWSMGLCLKLVRSALFSNSLCQKVKKTL